jgi:(p)ppGpp synthase/HD superfamily hydrolase
MGFLSTGRGIVIHTGSCSNVADFRKHPEKWIDVQWEEEIEGEFPVGLRVDVSNQRGVLAIIAAAVADMGANIENVAMEEREGKFVTMAFTLSVRDRNHLAQIMRHLRSNRQVLKLTRS